MGMRLLLVDDDERFRRLARRALVGDGLDLVGEAGDGAEALRLAAALMPDVVLLDIGLPDIQGPEIARRLPQPPEGPVVILISSRDAEYGARMALGVARGFIAKSALSGAAVRELVGTGA